MPPNSRLGLEPTVELLGQLAGVEEIRPMPALRFFKMGVDLDVKGGRDPAEKAERRRPEKPAPPPEAITPREIEAIRALQLDLPVSPEPFAAAAERHGFTVAELLEQGREFLRTGQMRRFAAVLAHRKAGFVQNGMGVWRVPEDEIDEVGAHRELPRRLALLPAADLPELAVQPLLHDPRPHQVTSARRCSTPSAARPG